MKVYNRMKKDLFLWELAFVVFLMAFVIAIKDGSIMDMFEGFLKILKMNGRLLTDYIVVGGLSATLFNAGILMVINLVIYKMTKMQMSGPIFAGILLILGFSFFGKNPLNVIPLYIGAFIYTRVMKFKFNRIYVVALFTTGIAPVVDFTIYELGIDIMYSLPLGILVGIFVGFITPLFGNQFVKFHGGYTLYNIGFTVGVVGLLAAAIFKSLGHNIAANGFISTDKTTSDVLYAFLWALSAFYFILGLIYSKGGKGYLNLLKEKGRGLTNYNSIFGDGLALLNVGILGFISLGTLMAFNTTMNGVVISGVLTLMGFGMAGNNSYNSSVIIIGVVLGALMFKLKLNAPAVSLAILFGTALAPIAGNFGFVPGVLAGMVHMALVTQTGAVTGFLNLYNNGFATGFVAAAFSSVFDGLKMRESN